MSELQAINSVYNIEIEKIDPNPDQPRKHFSDESLRDLAESIRRYGVMQPITVFRRESQSENGITTRYEIIAGERRWRASIVAGMSTIPAIIQEGLDSEQDRYELSILENLQREDLNPVDKARSFARLADEFGMKHAEIADRLGKSREYVTNAMRLLALPENVLDALGAGEINEGHTRPLLVLKDSPEELQVLFNEIKAKGLTVREAETTARKLSGNTKKTSRYNPSQPSLDPEMEELQTKLSGALGTSVSIDKKEKGGTLSIDFFSRDDLKKLLSIVNSTDGMAGIIAEANLAQTNALDEPTNQEQTAAETNFTHTEPVAANDSEPETSDRPESEQSHEPVRQPLGINPDKVQLGDDFDITPRGEMIKLDDSLADKPIMEQSAHAAPATRTMVDMDPVPADNTRRENLQREIDSLVGQNTTIPAAIDVSHTEELIIEPEPVQTEPVVTTAPASNPTDRPFGGQGIAQSPVATEPEPEQAPVQNHIQTMTQALGVDSQSVSDAGDTFVPQTEPQPVSELSGGISNGTEFVPEQPTPQQPQMNQSVAAGAQYTMGGLGGEQSSHSIQQPTAAFDASQPEPAAQPTLSKEKYPDGDPYRLDNFAV